MSTIETHTFNPIPGHHYFVAVDADSNALEALAQSHCDEYPVWTIQPIDAVNMHVLIAERIDEMEIYGDHATLRGES